MSLDGTSESMPGMEATESQALETQEAPREAEVEVASEQEFGELREAVVADIDTRAQAAKAQGAEQVEKVAGAYDLSVEAVTQVRQESGVDARIAANTEEIQALAETTKAEIKVVTTEGPEVESVRAPAEQQAERGLEARFENVISPKELAAAARDFGVARDIERTLKNVDSSALKTNELFYQETMTGQKAEGSPSELELHDSLGDYIGFRDGGITAEEVEGLVGALQKSEEATLEKLEEFIVRENAQIESFLKKPENQEKLELARKGMQDLFESLGVPLSRERLPSSQFLGKWGKNALLGGAGEYEEERDVALMLLPEKDLKEGKISDYTAHAYVHENFHGLSARTVVSAEEAEHRARREKVGFVTITEGHRKRKSALMGLNEGATEFFAQTVSKKNGLEITPGPYAGYVEDAVAVASIIEKQRFGASPESGITPVGMKNLLEAYTSPRGTLTLGKQMEQDIGRHTLALFDVLSTPRGGNFSEFVSSLEDYKAGRDAKPITVDSFELYKRGLKSEEIKELYPFIEIVSQQRK